MCDIDARNIIIGVLEPKNNNYRMVEWYLLEKYVVLMAGSIDG